ncbi:hypothetical protein M2271_007203 [Streptomyces sp. LBL]|uniref:hypothetical protein n=1 Tax=Streptomyces sp. LBL TaxID=2940562 RepID=UPI00247435A2|nr:hypothetical protein [Streptomyces sp. LBL]MDH6629367.1 hypothetical protein [Streptomyces sp. LBL]
MSVFTTTAYTTDKLTLGQRRVMLAAVDADGRLPDVANQRVLNGISESWARTDVAAGGRFLTAEGRAAVAPLGRFSLLARANPETGRLPGTTGHSDMLALVRDGLAVLQDSDGRPLPVADRWERGNSLRITERGRRLVGMPLTAPEFAKRHPVGSWAMWKREGETARPVQILGWPLADGTVRVLPRGARLSYAESAERPAPAEQIRPAPQVPMATVPDRSDDRRKTMTDRTPEPTLDDGLAALRGLAAAVVKPMTPRAETWEQVKAIEERATAGYELAERFTEFDERATADRRAPREWGISRELSEEQIAAELEKRPELQALGGFMATLAQLGLAPWQMANLVRKVQAHQQVGAEES